MKRLVVVPIMLVFSILACLSTANETEPPASPTSTVPEPQPTNTPPPLTAATAAPIGFVDQFDGSLEPGWVILNENPDLWYFTPEGWLAIHAQSAGFLDAGDGVLQVNLFNRPAPEGDFILTTHIVARPSENFQQAGMILIAAPDTYVSILNAFCEPCLPESNGSGIFIESFIAGEYKAQGLYSGHPLDETSFYLRLTYSAGAGTVTAEYSQEPNQWQTVGTISGMPDILYYGFGATNAPDEDGTQNDLMAFFDYIEMSLGPAPVRIPAGFPAATAAP